MRILIVTNSLSGGGAESSMRLINQQIRIAGYDSTLICLNKTEGETLNSGEIELERKWKAGLFQTVANYTNFLKELKKVKPSVVIVNCELPELYAALTPIRLDRVICVEHTSKPWATREFLGRIVRQLLRIRKADWVTVNKAQDRIWPYAMKSTFIPNPVATPHLSNEKPSKSNFVFIGRLRKEKGIELILEAISSEGHIIEVYGSGNLQEKLITKYSSAAIFHGFVKDPWKSINSNQILVIASEYEGDGKVIVEGILAGVPMLLLDNIDLRKFELEDANYFLDLENLKVKMRQSLEDRRRFRPSSEITTYLRDERDLKTVVGIWKSLLT